MKFDDLNPLASLDTEGNFDTQKVSRVLRNRIQKGTFDFPHTALNYNVIG